VRERAVRKALRSVPRLGFRGVNVTMPYKHIAAEVADLRSDLVERTGVANTLVVTPAGQLRAEATDGHAVQAAIEASPARLPGADVLLLGAGGAATEAAVACARGGAARITIWNRTPARAHELAAVVRDLHPETTLEVSPRLPIGEAAHIVVGAVPGDAVPESALAQMSSPALVVDLAYRPDRQPTPLIRAALDRGLQTVDGRELLVRQGAASFALWFGFDPPIEVMLRAVG
jgi:shikimate dehydrogenase